MISEDAKNILLKCTDGGKDIFTDVLGFSSTSFSTKKMFRDRPDDIHPSCHFKEYDGIWYYKDFGGAQTKGQNAIDYYATRNNMDFAQALTDLCQRYGIECEEKKPPKIRMEVTTASEAQKDGYHHFNCRDGFTDEELRFLGPGVTPKALKELGYESVESYMWVKDRRLITLYSDPYNMIFRRTCRKPGWKEGDPLLYKIYQPRGGKFKFSYLPIGMSPGTYIHGLYELRLAHEEHNTRLLKEHLENKIRSEFKNTRLKQAVLCSGERDAINIRARGDHPIWLNSETAELTGDILNEVYRYAERIIYIPDTDKTGVEQGRKNAFRYKSLYTVWLPDMGTAMSDQMKAKKDFRDWCGMHPDKEAYGKLLNNARPLQFYYLDGKRWAVNHDHLLYFLAENGFFKMKNGYSGDYDLYHIKGYGKHTDSRIVEKVDEEDIRGYLRAWMEEESLPEEAKNAILNSKYTEGKYLRDLPQKEISLKTCTKTSQDFVCSNTIVRVSESGIETVESTSVNYYVLEDKMIKHDITLTSRMFNYDPSPKLDGSNTFFDVTMTDEGMNCKLARVIYRMCELNWRKTYEEDEQLTEEEIREQQLALQNKLALLGFLTHQYKNVSQQWLPILTDWLVCEDPKAKNGRNGKSFIEDMLRVLMNKNIIRITTNKKGNMEYTHLFGSVTPYTDIIVFDEVPRNFDYDTLNEETSTGINVNRKNHDEYTIPFKDSPKILCISNYVPTGKGSSAEGRQYISVQSDYYHEQNALVSYNETRKISDEFGMNLWDTDYSTEDYNKDINFLFQCTQFYFYTYSVIHSKLNPPMRNLEIRKVQAEVNTNVAEFVGEYFVEGDRLNKRIPRDTVLNEYNDRYKDRRNPDMNNRQMKKELDKVCRMKGMVFNPENECTDKQNRRIRANNQEYYYIKCG